MIPKRGTTQVVDDIVRHSQKWERHLTNVITESLNSLYGATANIYFLYYIMEMAEAITTSGQLSLKWAANWINNWLNKILKTEGADYVLYADTDSVTGDSVIEINSKKMTIEEAWLSFEGPMIKDDSLNENYVKDLSANTLFTKGVTPDWNLVEERVKYIMRHKVEKRMYRITVGGNQVVVTGDHSIIAQQKSDGKMVSLKAHQLSKEKHRLINIVYTDTDSEVMQYAEKND